MEHPVLSEFLFPPQLQISPQKLPPARPPVECSVVVPVYNSEQCLPELARRIANVFDELGLSHELVLVDDGSTDQSWRTIKKLTSERGSILGISFRKNFGQDNALMAGLRATRGRCVVIMDDDLQHDPAYIAPLYERIEQGFDVVYADYSAHKKQALWKNAGSWLNDKLATVVLKKPHDIYLSPFKIISRPVVDEICKYAGAYPYVDGLIFRTTGRIGQIAVEHRNRHSGRSNYTLWKSVLVWSRLATNFSVLPLRIATCLGLASAVMGFLLALYFIGMYFAVQMKPEGWTSIFVSIQILGGIQLFAIGVAGEYIGRTFLTISRHPQYTVRESTSKVSASARSEAGH